MHNKTLRTLSSKVIHCITFVLGCSIKYTVTSLASLVKKTPENTLFRLVDSTALWQTKQNHFLIQLVSISLGNLLF